MIVQDTRPTPFGDDTPPSESFVINCQAYWVIVEDCGDDKGATATIERLRSDGVWEEHITISEKYLLDIDGTYRIGTVASCRCVVVRLEKHAGPCVVGGTGEPCEPCEDGFSPYVSDGTDGCEEGTWVDADGCTGVPATGPAGASGAGESIFCAMKIDTDNLISESTVYKPIDLWDNEQWVDPAWFAVDSSITNQTVTMLQRAGYFVTITLSVDFNISREFDLSWTVNGVPAINFVAIQGAGLGRPVTLSFHGYIEFNAGDVFQFIGKMEAHETAVHIDASSIIFAKVRTLP